MADRPPEFPAEVQPPEAPQIWHQYRLGPPVSVGWMDPTMTPTQLKALDDAWDVLVVRDEWRAWVREHLTSASIMLLVRPGLDDWRLRKTKSGVTMHLPAADVHEADRSGNLIALYLDVLHAIYSKWAQASGCPPPPPLAD